SQMNANKRQKGSALPKKIAVLMGGPGSERDVSLATGQGVSRALRSLGAEVAEIDVRDENFQLPSDVDLAFLTIHGTFGEDGQLQRILERRGIAYTGEGVEGSRTAPNDSAPDRRQAATRRIDSGRCDREE